MAQIMQVVMTGVNAHVATFYLTPGQWMVALFLVQCSSTYIESKNNAR